MPHLDLDHLFCVFGGGGESKSKVACKTAAALSSSGTGVQRGTVGTTDDADAPPESVLVRVPDGVGLAELFGAVLQRDGSTKGRSNPKAAARMGAARRLPAATAGKTAVVIGVLPAGGKMAVAQQERRVVARGWRRPAAGARVFASEAVGAEPVSPKVSCFGAVRSERRAAANDAPPEKKPSEDEERSGCWASVTAALRGLCCGNDPPEGESCASQTNSKASTLESSPVAVTSPRVTVARLGDAKLLASRRWDNTTAAAERLVSV